MARRPKLLKWLGPFGVAAVALLLANIAARIFLGSAFVLRTFPGSETWRAAWLARSHAGQASWSSDDFDAERGWTLRAGLRNVPIPGGATASSNQRGVRGTREYALARAPGTARIVAIGDSFTFGDEVNDDETFPALLEQTLRFTEVLNLGVHGYGHDQMLLRLRHDGVPYAPDIVILGWVDQDAQRNDQTFRDYLKPRFELRDQHLALTNVPIPPPDEYLSSHRWEPALFLLLQLAGTRLTAPPAAAPDMQLTTALLAEIVRVIREAGAVPLFVDLPDLRNEAGDSAYLKSFCADHAIDCVFTGPALRSVSAPLIRGSHYSPAANRAVAHAVAQYIDAHHLLPQRTF